MVTVRASCGLRYPRQKKDSRGVFVGISSGLIGLAHPDLTSVYDGDDPSVDEWFGNSLFYNPFFYTAVSEGAVSEPCMAFSLGHACETITDRALCRLLYRAQPRKLLGRGKLYFRPEPWLSRFWRNCSCGRDQHFDNGSDPRILDLDVHPKQ